MVSHVTRTLAAVLLLMVTLFSVYLFLPRLIRWRWFETICVNDLQGIAQGGQGPSRGAGSSHDVIRE